MQMDSLTQKDAKTNINNLEKEDCQIQKNNKDGSDESGNNST